MYFTDHCAEAGRIRRPGAGGVHAVAGADVQTKLQLEIQQERPGSRASWKIMTRRWRTRTRWRRELALRNRPPEEEA